MNNLVEVRLIKIIKYYITMNENNLSIAAVMS